MMSHKLEKAPMQQMNKLRTRAFLDYQLDLQGNGRGGFRLIAHFGWPAAEFPSDGSYVTLDEIASYIGLLEADFTPVAA